MSLLLSPILDFIKNNLLIIYSISVFKFQQIPIFSFPLSFSISNRFLFFHFLFHFHFRFHFHFHFYFHPFFSLIFTFIFTLFSFSLFFSLSFSHLRTCSRDHFSLRKSLLPFGTAAVARKEHDERGNRMARDGAVPERRREVAQHIVEV